MYRCCFKLIHLQGYLKTMQSIGSVCSCIWRNHKFHNWTEIAQLRPAPCLFCPCIHWRTQRNIYTMSKGEPKSRPLTGVISHMKLEWEGLWVFFKAECLIWEFFWCNEKSHLKLFLLEISFIIFWFAILMHKPKKLLGIEAASCQCPVRFLPKRNSRFYFCKHKFLHLLWNVCLACSSNRSRSTDV